MKEEWRDVVGYEGYYQVSNKGRVRSLDRRVCIGNGKTRIAKGKLLSLCPDSDGYLLVGLSKEGIVKTAKVQRVVAEAFIPENRDINTLRVNHIDENRSNNIVTNLEWATELENKMHSIRLQQQRGEVYHKAVLTVDDVKQIRARRLKGETVPSIKKSFPNVTKSAIDGIIYNKNWKWVK